MSPATIERESFRSAILFADLAGYSDLMGRDEIGTLEFMVSCTQMIDEVSARYGGRLVQTTGDGFLLLFDAPAAAVEFGAELHKLVAKRQADAERPAQFRVGIHCGDVHRSGGLIQGHAVNIAARLQTIALPGSCTVSQDVRDGLDDARHRLEPIGAPPLKNIREPIQLFRILPPDGSGLAVRPDPTEIQLIGRVEIRSDGARLSLPARQKTAQLLGYLALARGQRERDDKIAGLLWPRMDAATARRSFRECRRRLGAKLDAEFPNLLYHADGHTGLNELRFDTDLARTLSELRRGRVPDLLTDVPDWPERILEDHGRRSPVFQTWLRVTQSSWRARVLAALADLMDRSDVAAAVAGDAARATLALEPGNEVASARLITHFAAVGNRAAALSEYDRLVAYLRREHGLDPSPAVEDACAAAIGRAASARGAAPPAAPPADPPAAPPARRRLLRIAVEPFDGPDNVDPHLVQGFRSALVSNLTRFREWSVVEVDARLPASANGDAGDCNYVIGGTQKDDTALGLHLRDLSGDRLLWSDELSVGSSTWVAMQREAVGRIAAYLETYISADRLANMIGADEPLATSHDSWLRAEQIFARWTPEAAEEASALLRQVIAEDPAFAPAYSSLASFCNVRHVIRPGSKRDAADAREAHELAERAVELDPLDARNHLAVAWTAALTGTFERAAIHLDMAASLNPNGPATLVSCAMGRAFIGEADQGEALVDHILRIAPMLTGYQWCYVAAVHFLAGRYEDAIRAARMSGDRIVDNQGWIAAAMARLGRLEEARSAFDALIEGVRPVWAGQSPPTAEAVYDWFVGAYPLRRESDRSGLADSLALALRGQ